MGRKRKLKPKTYELEIESLSHEGRGIAHLDEKVIFVSGALPGETVIAERCFSRAKFEQPPQIPNTAHLGVMRLGEANNTSLTCASSKLLVVHAFSLFVLLCRNKSFCHRKYELKISS
jgi:hypothetical protein